MFTARYNSLYLIQGAAHGIFIQKEKKLEDISFAGTAVPLHELSQNPRPWQLLGLRSFFF